jgi:hypothetical protein
MSESKEIVNWEEKLAAEAKAVATLERPSLTSVSLRSGVMSINDVAVPGNKLDCVVIASVFEHQYFAKPYDPNNITAPDCFALSLTGKDMVPHDDVPEKQSTICANCGKFQWGSDPKPNSKGKACKEKRRLAILPAASLKDGEVLKAEMATMTLPVTSVRNWGNYVNSVAAEFGRPPWAMLTEISVHPHMKNQFEVKFQARGVVSDGYLSDLNKRAIGAADTLMTPYDMSTWGQEPEPQAAPAKTNKKY